MAQVAPDVKTVAEASPTLFGWLKDIFIHATSHLAANVVVLALKSSVGPH